MRKDGICLYNLCYCPVEQLTSVIAEIPPYTAHRREWNIVSWVSCTPWKMPFFLVPSTSEVNNGPSCSASIKLNITSFYEYFLTLAGYLLEKVLLAQSSLWPGTEVPGWCHREKTLQVSRLLIECLDWIFLEVQWVEFL